MTEKDHLLLSLRASSCRVLIQHAPLLRHALGLGLPSFICRLLLQEAILATKRYPAECRRSIKELVSCWKQEEFHIKNMAWHPLLTDQERNDVMLAVIEGLLSLQPSSRLQTVNFLGLSCHWAFQLPVLWLPLEMRGSSAVLDAIHSQCKEFMPDGDSAPDSLSWKLTQLLEESPVYHFQGSGNIDVLLETQVTLTDWGSMGDEMLGLLLQHLGPFKLKVIKLAVENFHLRQMGYLRMLIHLTDTKCLRSLGIYGQRKSVRVAMWEMKDDLELFSNLQIFAMAASGPKLLRDFYSTGPNDDEVVAVNREVFSSWKYLQEIYYNRVTLTNQLAGTLSGIEAPLKTLYFYATNLSLDDLIYISNSHHLPHLEKFCLEKMVLRQWAEVVIQIVENGRSLRTLAVRDGDLQFHHKVAILALLQSSTTLTTLNLLESEDMLSTDGYQELVTMATQIPTLERFYVFPFLYKPFELFYRDEVQAKCKDILYKAKRGDLLLLY